MNTVNTNTNANPINNYKIISIDVGIVRLAFALFERTQGNNNNEVNEFVLNNWSVVNLTKTSDVITKCSAPLCKTTAKVMKNNVCYCTKHSKTVQGFLPSTDLKPAKINKLKLDGLFALANKYGIAYQKEPALKKSEIIAIIHAHIAQNAFQPIEKTNASELDLNTIGRNIKQNFDTIFAGDNDVSTINEVIVENQLSPRAIRMKTIQGMISQYFIMRNDNIKIKFVNATNKLKDAKKDQTPPVAEEYKDRKDLSILMCKKIITTDSKYKDKWSSFLSEQKKKDGIADLADCFLQGLWYIDKMIK